MITDVLSVTREEAWQAQVIAFIDLRLPDLPDPGTPRCTTGRALAEQAAEPEAGS
jgi:hypothetical protein